MHKYKKQTGESCITCEMRGFVRHFFNIHFVCPKYCKSEFSSLLSKRYLELVTRCSKVRKRMVDYSLNILCTHTKHILLSCSNMLYM